MNSVFSSDYLIMADSYSQIMNDTVIPWLESRQREILIPGFEGRPLYCVSYHDDHSIGTVLIVHGFTENAFKYSELIWSLLHLHFSVVAFDQRGHGRSWRPEGISDCSVTHVDRFSDYVEDLKIVSDSCLSNMPKPFFLFSHSMGGAVSSLMLEQDPGIFSAAVLSAPMIAPNLGGIPTFFASALTLVADALGKQKKKPFFMKAYSGPEDFSTSCASDPKRFAWYDEVKYSRKEFQNSVPTYHWSRESIHVTKRILAPGAPEKISCPLLLFTADRDYSVLPEPQKEFVRRVSQGKQIYVRNSRHEIYRSTNDVLFPWWHEVISFYTEHLH